MQAGLMLPGSVRGDSRRKGRQRRGRQRRGEKDCKLVAKDSSLYTVMVLTMIIMIVMALV